MSRALWPCGTGDAARGSALCLSVCTRTSCLLPQRRGRCLLRISDLLPLAVVRPLLLLSNLRLPLAPITDWRCRAAMIVKRGDPNLSHARSRVWSEACRDVRAACQSNMYQETCRVEDRVDKSMFRGDGWGNGRSSTSNVLDYALRQEAGISPPVIIPTQENDCRCRSRGCGDGHQRAGSGG